MHGSYLAAYSDGSDCNPSTQRTVTLSSFDSNIEIVAFGLTAGSTRAFRIWERYCDCSAGLVSRRTKNAPTLKMASEVAPAQTSRPIVHQDRTVSLSGEVAAAHRVRCARGVDDGKTLHCPWRVLADAPSRTHRAFAHPASPPRPRPCPAATPRTRRVPSRSARRRATPSTFPQTFS